jgi:hypothetical protein
MLQIGVLAVTGLMATIDLRSRPTTISPTPRMFPAEITALIRHQRS